MIPLSSDPSVHYEILRQISVIRYGGADVAELLEIAGRIQPDNLDSFHDQFYALASRVDAQAQAINSARHPVSARDAYFRAATYYRAADFYLHGNPADPRIYRLWELQQVAFDKAMALMERPGVRLTLQGQGFTIPAIYFTAGGDPAVPKPTIIAASGYDGSQEELFHGIGIAALERGFNVILYEGPGQPTVRRQQQKGFITEWEQVVTPVVDHLATLPEVDMSKLALIGVSMGGFLCLRAAAFEHRLAAVIAIDGVYDVYEAYRNVLPAPMKQLLDADDGEALDRVIREALAGDHLPVAMRWGVEQGLWSFNMESPYEWLAQTRLMTLKGIADQIRCPAWIGEAVNDIFFQEQPQKVRDALGAKATYAALTDDDAAGNHCHVGAQVFLHQQIFDWFEDIIAEGQ